MCGIAGVVRREPRGVSPRILQRMQNALRHRGPDGTGWFADEHVGLAHVRLAVLDVEGGAQPMSNADASVVVTFNGEIFNHAELRYELESFGFRFRTRSDTEVLVHGYEHWGRDVVERLNGQFAFAIYDRRGAARTVLLARDRHGICPLFYAERGGDLTFASEIKAILAGGEIESAVDPRGLDEVFTFWGALAPRTPFRGVQSLEPGMRALWSGGRLHLRRYDTPDYSEVAREAPDAIEQLDRLLRSSVALRLNADVPVGAYLSGGLDSSIVCALAVQGTPHRVRTLSVSFDDPAFDESAHQRRVADALATQHVDRRITNEDIAAVFPEVVRHAESPLVRSAPAPLYILSALAREHGLKVVLTGEGSDEMFWGYDIFKETAVRLLCHRFPASERAPRLLDQLNRQSGGRSTEFWRRYLLGASPANDPLFSHMPRWRMTSWIKELYSGEFRDSLDGFDPVGQLRDRLPHEFTAWTPLARAAWLESKTLLSSYLLSSQGDRMAMAHGVESRVPFLDHRVAAFAASLPTRSKVRGLRDKDILRRWARTVLPDWAARRPKVAYRAPEVPPFFGPNAPPYVEDLLSHAGIRKAGIFDATAVAGLVRRCKLRQQLGMRESQALVAVISTQLWHHQLVELSSAGQAAA